MTITIILIAVMALSLISGIAKLLYVSSDRGQAEMKLSQMTGGK